MDGSYTAMLVTRPPQRSLPLAVVDGTLVVMPLFWGLVDLVASAAVRAMAGARTMAR